MPSPLKQRDKPFVDAWASNAALWGTRHGVGESLDRYFGWHAPSFSSGFSHQLSELGFGEVESKQSGTLGYRQILKLGNDHIDVKGLSSKTYIDTVKKNTEQFRNQLKSALTRDFLQDVTAKGYVKETLWQANVRPFQDLLSGSKKNLCMNLSYTAGIGLAGFGIVKTGVQHYRHWKRQEDGSIAKQWQTAYETGKALCQKTFQSFGSWEAAGVGMAIGQALLPIGAIPIGGILVGALFATTAYKAIGKLFPSLARPGLSES